MLNFIRNFIKNPKYTGAIAPSGKDLTQKMLEDIDFKTCNILVEYGAGTGVFTEKIIKEKNDDSLFLVFEVNQEFFKNLKNLYGDKKNVILINDNVENIEFYLDKFGIRKVDYIISGLPFTSLPINISEKILKTSAKILNQKGYFITFQYSLLKKNLLNKYFNNIKIKRSYFNIPPAYILIFQVKN